MYKSVKLKFVGVSPLLMHNSQTVDPTNKFARALKEISGKRKKVDADYENLILQKKKGIDYRLTQKHTRSDNSKIFVCVRKRPISTKELQAGEIDCVSSLNPRLLIHECKIKIDGITKYIEDHEFYFDNVFSEKEATEDLYTFSI